MALHAPQPGGQLHGVLLLAVHPAHQRVLEDHPPAGFGDVVAAGLQHILHGIGLGDGHGLAADVVIGRVEGHAQRYRQILLRQLIHLRHNAAGGQAHVPQADLHALRLPQKPQEFHHVVVIVEGLAAAHQHNVVHPPPLPQEAVGTQHLPQHFARGQVPHAALERAGAEGAAHPAPHLGGDAQGVSVVVVHQHALHTVAVLQAEEELGGVVDFRPAFLDDLHRLGHGVCLQLLPQLKGQVGHAVKVRALVNPAEDLLPPEGGQPLLPAPGRQLRAVHVRQNGHTRFLRMRQM